MGSLTCTCHASRCESCSLCSYCGCAHDGKSIEEKLRRRGRGRKERVNTASHAKLLRLAELLGVSSSIVVGLPSLHVRQNASSFQELSQKHQGAMCNFIDTICSAVCESAFPANPPQLMDASTKKRKACDIDSMLEKEGAKLLRTTLACSKNAGSSTREGKVMRGLMCKSIPQTALTALMAETGQSISKFRFMSSRRDATLLEQGESLLSGKQSRRRYSPLSLDIAIAFILLPEFVGLLSWGTRTVRLEGGIKYTLPYLTLKATPTAIFEAYLLMCHSNGHSPISRSSFLRVVGAITGRTDKGIAAVDYVTGEISYKT